MFSKYQVSELNLDDIYNITMTMQLLYNYFRHSINYKITMLIVSINCQFLINNAPFTFFTLAARKKERPFKDFQMLLCLTLSFGGVGEEVQKVKYIFNVLVALYSQHSCKGLPKVRKIPGFLQYIFWINQYKYTTQAPNLCRLHRVFDFQK